jgi:hypothetical protein
MKTTKEENLQEAIEAHQEFLKVNSSRNPNKVQEMKMTPELISRSQFLLENLDLCIQERAEEIRQSEKSDEVTFNGTLGSVYTILERFVKDCVIDADFGDPEADAERTLNLWWHKNQHKFKK